MRYFSDGVALGTKAFVEELITTLEEPNPVRHPHQTASEIWPSLLWRHSLRRSHQAGHPRRSPKLDFRTPIGTSRVSGTQTQIVPKKEKGTPCSWRMWTIRWSFQASTDLSTCKSWEWRRRRCMIWGNRCGQAVKRAAADHSPQRSSPRNRASVSNAGIAPSRLASSR